MESDTIAYYNKNAKKFNDATFQVAFKETQDHFIHYIKSNGVILDFGCGSGRDTKYFLEKGYQVSAMDGSKELCEIASKNTGIEVSNQRFQEFCDIEKYDGIWACSSLLHLPIQELENVLHKIYKGLKQDGFLYGSFKYGKFEGIRNGRYFCDMTEKRFEKLIDKIGEFKLIEHWITTDVRQGRDDEKWLNLILKKV